MKQYIIMMELAHKTRYEFYLKGIKRSNLDDTIVRWELQYDLYQHMTLGSTATYGNRIYGKSLEQFINDLTQKGFIPVTFKTKTFA